MAQKGQGTRYASSPRHPQVQKKLPDEDKRLLQSNMLVGIAPELIGDTPSEMRAISIGKGEHFIVQEILRSGDIHTLKMYYAFLYGLVYSSLQSCGTARCLSVEHAYCCSICSELRYVVRCAWPRGSTSRLNNPHYDSAKARNMLRCDQKPCVHPAVSDVIAI